MNDKINSTINVLPPFKRLCMTIGELPASYLETMSYYETILWLIKYLKETVIPTVNNNAEAVSELQELFIKLQNYVNNYFDDLNIQEEINNKLDEMVEDGTLQNILNNYANITRVFNTTIEMLLDNTLVNGEKIKTLGYYEIDDGGTSEFIITDTLDSSNYQIELSNNLYATLIIKNILNVKQIGARGDNESNDTLILQEMFNKCRNANITSIYFPKGIYIVSDTLLPNGINGLNLSGENDDIYNSTIIMRTADCTVFNFGGVMELSGISYRSDDLILTNITFRDSSETFTNYPFATLHYTQHFTIQNCTISCRNKALDLKQCYDSRFINTDFTAGGNIYDAMITMHGGKHASLSEIGWDSANCITFECCRFERYFGCAIQTTHETQPSSYNPNYDPAVAVNVNTLWFNMCRFEAPTLTAGHHLDFNYTNNIRLNIQMTILDGQPDLQPINFTRCLNIYGKIHASFNQSRVLENITFNDFEQPIIDINDNSGKFDLTLSVGSIFSHYLLDYFINVVAGDNTRRTMNLNLIYNGLNKKIFNQTSNNQNINILNQGRQINYGQYENGFGIKINNEINNEYFSNMTYDSTNERYSLLNRYSNTSNSNRTLDEIISDDNFSYHRFDSPIVNAYPIMIIPNRYPSSLMSSFRSAGSTSRAIMYASDYPQTEQSDVLFKAGDIIFNTTPTTGEYVGWVCTTSGNPGTWKGFGMIE